MMKDTKFYPVSMPFIDKAEKELVNEALDSTWISSSGKYIAQFEHLFSEYCGRKYGCSVSNGTTAIEIALHALDLPKGSEVIVPSFTFIASVNPILHKGLIPVFCDADPKTLTMDVNDIEHRITSKTKAIMVVPLYGHPVDYDGIINIAKRHGLYIIEDAAEAHGSLYKGRKCGSFGDISTFSFFANKIMTTGEGGICVTDNKLILDKIHMLKNHGMCPDTKYHHPVAGFNNRMTNIQAAIGVAQISKLDTILQKRRQIAQWYEKYLGPLRDQGILAFQPVAPYAQVNYWFFSIMLREDIDRDEIGKILRQHGVDNRPFFKPVHKQECYREYAHYELPVTDRISRQGLNLPTYHQLTEQDIVDICAIISNVLTL